MRMGIDYVHINSSAAPSLCVHVHACLSVCVCVVCVRYRVAGAGSKGGTEAVGYVSVSEVLFPTQLLNVFVEPL